MGFLFCLEGFILLEGFCARGVRIVVDVVEDLQVTDAESGLVRLGLGVGLKLFLSGLVAETVDHRRERPTRRGNFSERTRGDSGCWGLVSPYLLACEREKTGRDGFKVNIFHVTQANWRVARALLRHYLSLEVPKRYLVSGPWHALDVGICSRVESCMLMSGQGTHTQE